MERELHIQLEAISLLLRQGVAALQPGAAALLQGTISERVDRRSAYARSRVRKLAK
jgi:hypothetical protein